MFGADRYGLSGAIGHDAGGVLMDVAALIYAGEQTSTPWRFRLDELAWRDMVDMLKGDDLPFVGLWCDGADVHALFLPDGHPLAATLALEGGRYPALSPARVAASLYERAIYDLFGAEAMWAVDVRPLLDHDVWSAAPPLCAAPGRGGQRKGLVAFQPSDAMAAAKGRVEERGPATGDLAPPFYTRLVLSGTLVANAETQTGYAHRGIAARSRHTRVEDVCRLSSRVAAGSSVAHQVAFCQAVENACNAQVGAEVALLRVTLLEMERLFQHLYTLAGMARLAGAQLVASHCMALREKLVAEAAPITGSRLLMDVCIPGGLSVRDATQMGDLCARMYELGQKAYPQLVLLWREYPGLSALLGRVGRIQADDLERVGLDGPVARAAGWDCDGRRIMPAYDGLWRYTSGRQNGTAEDRALLLLDEMEESLRMLDLASARIGLNAGGTVPLSMQDGEGTGLVEGPWGGVLYWVRLAHGRVAEAFCRKPETSALLVFEQALPNHAAEDAALLACSLGMNAAALDG
ncbi:MAG: NADH-quinone oxidoreductase subunit D [Acetobacter fabarum]|uniref:NADH-quinone oxidoreductase subunit D-related protein n=1 Tax=Acetobacter fabarum TaxID=483199 RepID=UPI0039E9BF83